MDVPVFFPTLDEIHHMSFVKYVESVVEPVVRKTGSGLAKIVSPKEWKVGQSRRINRPFISDDPQATSVDYEIPARSLTIQKPVRQLSSL